MRLPGSRINKRVYQAIRQDGISDITGGLMLACFAFFFYNFNYSLGLILGSAAQAVLLPLARKYVTFPRVGFVKFHDPSEKHREVKILQALLILATIAILILVGIYIPDIFPFLAFLTIAVLTALDAIKTGLIMDYIFSVVFLLCGVSGTILAFLSFNPFHVTAYISWILAAVLIPAGIFQLVVFLGKYPKSSREVTNEIAG
jgi:hypothetical protein